MAGRWIASGQCRSGRTGSGSSGILAGSRAVEWPRKASLRWSADIPRDPATARSYPVILTNMKTAISVPDDTFERASRRAHDLGMSRSEFFTRAAARYLDELEAESLTEQIDTAIASLEATDDSAADAVALGRRLLIEATDEW
ncbi:MAG: hypothetical protein QOF81_269 [Acidimicrobiaceae bacterium]|nr:hypothetical protein [Acidimicrobiaceae bacterium]